MTLYLLRHFPTSHNSDDLGKERIRGWGDQGVSAEGKAMVPAAVQALQDHPPQLIVTSDLPRSQESGELLGKALNAPVVPSSVLRTWNVGSITGKPVSEAKPQLDELQHTKRTTPAPDGESYQDFFDRWGQTLSQLRDMGRNADVLAVLHGRQVYATPNHLAGRGPARIPTHGAPDPGDILAVNEQAQRLDYVHRSGAAPKVTA